MEDIIKPGLLGIDDAPSDYQLGATLELPQAAQNYWDSQIQYHQPDISSVSCTVHAALGCVSDLLGYEFTPAQRAAMWAEALNRGADPSVGWYLRKAVDLVREYASEYTGAKLLSFRVSLLSDSFAVALSAGYTVNIGFAGNSAYNEDRMDGTLDGVSFTPQTYGHAVRVTASKDDPNLAHVIVDNYSKRTWRPNTYTVPIANIEALVRNGCFYQFGYIFVVQSDFDRMNAPMIPLWATESAAKAKAAGVIEDWSNPLAPIDLNTTETRSRFEWVVHKLGGYRAFFNKLGLANVKDGEFNQSHLAVVLDRAGFFDS